MALLACRDPSPPPPPSPPSRVAARPHDVPRAPPDVPSAAPTVARPAPAPSPVPVDASVAAQASPESHADAGAETRGDGFLGLNDDAVLARICNAPIERFERNRGGSTISFRVRLAGGQRALFKPQQRAEVANFRAELAAYRMSRMLGLARVPPACGRMVPRDALQRAADGSGDPEFSRRVLTELLGRGDNVPGAMLFWVPGQLESVPETESYPLLLDAARPLPDDKRTLAADLSTLLVFDFVNDNVDRWSGGNILRPRVGAGEPPGRMLYMDNGAAFSAIHEGLGARPDDQARRLGLVQRFSRSVVESLRVMTEESLRRAMSEDPLGACLSDAQIRAVLTRRDRVMAHVRRLAEARSEAELYPFP